MVPGHPGDTPAPAPSLGALPIRPPVVLLLLSAPRAQRGVPGPGAVALPAEHAPGYQIRDSPASRRGRNFTVGNGEKVPNEGQVCLNLEADIGEGGTQPINCVFQVADLTRPLMSVSQVCDENG